METKAMHTRRLFSAPTAEIGGGAEEITLIIITTTVVVTTTHIGVQPALQPVGYSGTFARGRGGESTAIVVRTTTPIRGVMVLHLDSRMGEVHFGGQSF